MEEKRAPRMSMSMRRSMILKHEVLPKLDKKYGRQMALSLAEVRRVATVRKQLLQKNLRLSVLAVAALVFWLAALITVSVTSPHPFKCSLDSRTGLPCPDVGVDAPAWSLVPNTERMVMFDEIPYDYNPIAETLLCITCLISFLNMYSIWDYYRFQLVHCDQDIHWSDRQQAYMKPSVLRSHYRWPYLLELAICVIQPYPFLHLLGPQGSLDGSTGVLFSNPGIINHEIKFGVLIFFRLYLVLRVQRDMSHTIGEVQRSGRDPLVHYDWFFCLRLRFKHHPFKVTTAITIVLVVACSISFFTMEWSSIQQMRCNGCNIVMFGLSDSIYLTLITMTTVGYGELSPTTQLGQVVAVITAIVGIILTSLFIAAIAEEFQINEHEHKAVVDCKLKKRRKREREAAASVIQAFWHSCATEISARRAVAVSGVEMRPTEQRSSVLLKWFSLSTNAKLRQSTLKFRRCQAKRMSLENSNADGDTINRRFAILEKKIDTFADLIDENQESVERQLSMILASLSAMRQASLRSAAAENGNGNNSSGGGVHQLGSA